MAASRGTTTEAVRTRRDEFLGLMERSRSLAAKLSVAACAGVFGVFFPDLAGAGNLTRCDQAQMAAHDTIMDAYDRLLSEIDDRIAGAKIAGVDLVNYPYLDRNGRLRSVDIAGLRADIQRQQEKDAGRAVRKVASDCSSETLENAARMATNIAVLGMSAVVSNRMTNIELPEQPFDSDSGRPLFGGSATARQ